MAQCELGKTYKDEITGYKGVAVCRTEWIEGCTRIGLQAKMNKDGEVPKIVEFDEPALITQTVKEPGGPRPSPQRSPGPQRR